MSNRAGDRILNSAQASAPAPLIEIGRQSGVSQFGQNSRKLLIVCHWLTGRLTFLRLLP